MREGEPRRDGRCAQSGYLAFARPTVRWSLRYTNRAPWSALSVMLFPRHSAT